MTTSVLNRLKVAQLQARRSRDNVAANVLGTVVGECANRSYKLRPVRALTDHEVTRHIQATVRSLKETIKLIAGKPERADRMQQMQHEIATLEPFLPQQLTDQEIEEIAVRQHSIMNMQQILEHLRQHFPNRYDPKHAAEIVRSVIHL